MIVIKINPYKDKNSFMFNNDSVSVYTSLSQYYNCNVLDLYRNCLGIISAEVNDNYQLQLICEEFDYLLMKDMVNYYNISGNPVRITNIIKNRYTLNMSVNDKMNIAERLLSNYGLIINRSNYKIPVYTNCNMNFPREYFSVVNTVSQANFIFTNDITSIDVDNIDKDNKVIICVTNDQPQARIGVNSKYMNVVGWFVNESQLNSIINSIVDRFYKIEIIKTVKRGISNRMGSLSQNDRNDYMILDEIDPLIRISNIESIEVGNTATVNYNVYPSNYSNVSFNISSSNNSIVSVERNKKLRANSIGVATIGFTIEGEQIPFFTQDVRTYQNDYVESISLSVSNNVIDAGNSISINLNYEPRTAVDANNIVFSVSDTNIASINRNGVLTARRGGVVRVFASTNRIREYIDITIRDVIQNISISIEGDQLYVGQRYNLNVNFNQGNFTEADYEIYTSDESIASIETTRDGRRFLHANGIGDFEITCRALRGNAITIVQRSVGFIDSQSSRGLTSICILLVALQFIFWPLEFVPGIIICAIGAIILSIIAAIKNRDDIFWYIILIATSIIFLISFIG